MADLYRRVIIEWVDGKLLQTNKKYSHLKLRQKEKIYQWIKHEEDQQ